MELPAPEVVRPLQEQEKFINVSFHFRRAWAFPIRKAQALRFFTKMSEKEFRKENIPVLPGEYSLFQAPAAEDHRFP